jgi:copper resistance protein B
MKRLLILLAATALTTPALAQHGGHHPSGHTMPMPKSKPKSAPKPAPRKAPAKAKPAAKKPVPKTVAKPAAKKAAAKPAVRRPAPRKAAPRPVADPHAGHSAPAKQAADPHAGHSMPIAPPAQSAPPAAADPHAGHTMPQTPVSAADPHAGHDMSGMDQGHPTPPTAPPPAAAFSGPAHAADLVFDPAEMAEAREELREEHGSMETYKVLVDQLEAKLRNGRDGYAWDAQAWYGGDIDKLWLKTEGEGAFGESVEGAEVQALWSHAIDPWFDLQLGVRHDFRPDPERTHLVLGVQGLAPYWFEVDAAAFVSDKGEVTARLEAEYDLRVTQKLILQPRVELDLSLQDVPEIGIGSGLSSGEIGARLRYEIRPEFAPYVGIEYERAFGGTADFRRAAGEKAGGLSLLVGLRTWF